MAKKGAKRINDLYKLLGTDADSGKKPVLIPIPKAHKAPVFKGWQKVSWAATQKDNYKEKLYQECNIGVLLGMPSGGLCTIDVDDDDYIEQLLELNPGFSNTLTTKGQKGIQLWFWCKEDPDQAERNFKSWPKLYPIDFDSKDRVADKSNLHWGEWRAEGGQSVISGIHPSGPEYTILVKQPPLEIYFRQIRWPDEIQKPWTVEIEDQLKDRYGPPWMEKDGKISSICDMFWVGRFALEHEVLYEADEKNFYIYDNSWGSWDRRENEEIKVQFSYDILRAAREKNEHVLYSNRFRGNNRLGALASQLKGEVAKRDVFRVEEGIVHLANGMLDINQKKPKLLNFNPRYYSRNRIPIPYVPGATCPRFMDEVLSYSLPDEDISLLQRWVGCLLLGTNLIQRLMILSGTSGGGKSTMMKIFQNLIGMKNCAELRTDNLAERFELSAYIGKSALFGVDVPGNFLIHRGAYIIKGLIGGDLKEAELKGGGFLAFIGHFNIGITCNSRLIVRLDQDMEAWARRLGIIVLEREPVKKPIANFANIIIETEGPGIVNWAIEGALALLSEFKRYGRIKFTDEQQRRVDNLLAESDSIREFVRRRVMSRPKADVTTEELLQGYVTFCDEIGWGALTSGVVQKQLPNAMREIHRAGRGNDIVRNNKGQRGFRNAILLDHDVTDEDRLWDKEKK